MRVRRTMGPHDTRSRPPRPDNPWGDGPNLIGFVSRPESSVSPAVLSSFQRPVVLGVWLVSRPRDTSRNALVRHGCATGVPCENGDLVVLSHCNPGTSVIAGDWN